MKPWALGPFELIKHAESHRVGGGDFDRRMALIGYDNAIEVSIATFLSLNPMQRSGWEFPRKEVDEWLTNFNKKLSFLDTYVTAHLGRNMEIPKEEILFFHQLRNELYHAGNGMVPAEVHVHRARAAALWVFSVLFDVDAETLLELKDESAEMQATTVAGIDNLSITTEFLSAFVQMSKDLSELLALAGEKGDLPISEKRTHDFLRTNLPFELASKIQDVLSRAPGIRDEIVEERLSIAGRDQLPGLVTELNELNEGIKIQLRSYQVEAVDAAMTATLEALSSGCKDIGVVVQPIGTGITTTASAYIVGILEDRHLDNYRVLVVTDRQVIEDQLLDIVSYNLAAAQQDVRKVEGRSELRSALEHGGSRVLFVTAQKLVALSSDGVEVPNSFIAIDFNVARSWEALCKVLQNCYRIRFLSAPLVNASGHAKIAYQYSLQSALRESFLIPVHVTRKSLLDHTQTTEIEAVSETEEYAFSAILAADFIEAVGADLGADLKINEHQPLKAVVLAPNQLAAARLIEVLVRADNIWKEKSLLLTSRLSNSERSAIWQAIRDESSPIRLLVTTVGMISGVDVGVISKAYVLTRLSRIELLTVTGLLMRPYPGKEQGVIVDYVGSTDSMDLLGL